MAKKIRILIVDDHKMVRDGIRSMLELGEKKFRFLVDEAQNGEEGIEKVRKYSYDLIIMDYQLPQMTGVDAVKEMLLCKENSKILAISSYDEYMYIDNMIKTGAMGYVLKSIGPEELLNAVEAIIGGKNYFSNDIAVKLISHDNKNVQMARLVKQKSDQANYLSKREMEVLKLIASEFSNDQIAARLFISKRTVDTHRQNLMKKLECRNTAGLVKYAIDIKILEEL
jgi:DNA-binding NarL/FixJ family response regulator